VETTWANFNVMGAATPISTVPSIRNPDTMHKIIANLNLFICLSLLIFI
jgi:hypothetical protein